MSIEDSIRNRIISVITGSIPQEEELDYVVEKGALHYKKETSQGIELIKLCNFKAEIIAEIVVESGMEPTRYLKIKGKLANGTELPTVEVSAAEFPKMTWIERKWGATAVILPVSKSKEHIKVAIQQLSKRIPTKTVYTELGWKKIGDEWVYLSQEKTIGKDGALGTFSVSLEGLPNADYQLPDPPEGQRLHQAIRDSLSLADLAPDEVIIPVLASVYRCPLGEAALVDFSVFIVGASGGQKSEITALAQAHFGKNFHGKNLPENWSSTGNALEKKSYLVKDAIFTVDDFKPVGSRGDIIQLHKKADQLFRGQGNKGGRGRLSPGSVVQESYYPRGLIISSGEVIPNGHSLRARLLVIEMIRGMVDLTKLTEIQRKSGRGSLSSAMSAYVKWLAPQMNRLKQTLPTRIREKSRQLVADGLKYSHARLPDIIASIIVGGEEFLRFARDIGALSSDEYREQLERFEIAILKAAEEQSSAKDHEDFGSRFTDLLRAAIATGRVHLADADDGEQPKEPEKYGWRRTATGWSKSGRLIGWVSGEDIYLEPQVTLSALQSLAGSQGSGLQIGPKTLNKRLAEGGILKTVETGTNTVRKMIGGHRCRVLHIDASVILECDQSSQSDQSC